MASIFSCTEVSETCPVSATLYGYIPNMAGNIAIDTIFGLAMLTQLVLLAVPPRTNGLPRRHWPFSIFALVGIVLEFLGYLARVWMGFDVWNEAAITVQLICIIIGPTFLVGAIYLVLSHLIRQFGPQHSRLAPKAYTWVFVSCEIASILVQALGGGLAAVRTSGPNLSTMKAGGDLIIAGIVFQVAVMVFVCGLVGDYVYRWTRALDTGAEKESMDDTKAEGLDAESPDSHGLPHEVTTRFKWLVGLMAGAYVFVLVRSIYRIYEFAGGWGGPPMRSEPSFLVLDGAMIALASICMTLGHPAVLFPEMCLGERARR